MSSVARTIEGLDSFQKELLSDRFRECLASALAVNPPSFEREKKEKAEDLYRDEIGWLFDFLGQQPGQLADALNRLSHVEFTSFCKTFTEKLVGVVNYDTTVEDISNEQIAGAFVATARVFRS